jgi:hypothetical protein
MTSPLSLISRTALDAEPWPAYVLDAAGSIVAVNDAWDRVGGPIGAPSAVKTIGSRWLDHIRGGEVKVWHARLLVRLLDDPTPPRQRAFQQLCECNTPDERRVFMTRFEPLTTPTQRVAGIMVVTWLVEKSPQPPDEPRYRGPKGIVVQCAGCRRVRTEPGGAWELVRHYVESPPDDLSHGLCQVCLELYYPGV